MEFALVAPFLFLIIFGIIEFGWAFLQFLDTRHGARETARLAAVDYTLSAGDDAATRRNKIIQEACDRMDSSSDVSIELTRVDGPDNGLSGEPLATDADDVGDSVTVHVNADLDTLTGFLDWAIGGIDLDSTVEVRLEQDASWAPTTALQACP